MMVGWLLREEEEEIERRRRGRIGDVDEEGREDDRFVFPGQPFKSVSHLLAGGV